MIGVAVPAHNEREHIALTLQSIQSSIVQLGERALVVVVADACNDDTAQAARPWADAVLEIQARDVGTARATGAQWLLEHGVDWVACTDADSLVPPDWLSAQKALACDVFCGIVQVHDWGNYSADVIAAFHATTPQDGHPHIHGANMGLSRRAYELVGGFQPAHAHEDVSLIRCCEAAGLHIERRIRPCVTTSARRDARAREGFGDFLLSLEQQILQPTTAAAYATSLSR